ncbi:endonuclease III domain-containing protein [Thermoplasma sp. Kam2015]|uniref:endonuclease III domain-containing protein n=1 Tax=Thermoplasma sp. Kam2015 TaxID=2094122 RepID=UPI000D8B5061|nr:endonuclease III domain-containing protein [Thermoplasma sp. Kam2015]PYB68893.1 endonuclease III domain-containing protein [Thermoplasma sp. Kam2015]
MGLYSTIYDDLFCIYGDLRWWPADSRDEVVIGAILTQNTSWNNVEKAISRLKENGLMTLADISRCDRQKLAEIIRPAGFYNQKADRLISISRSVVERFGSIENIKDLQTAISFFSGLKGIGQETLDSILLYALDFPVFVIDRYTKRFIERCYGITGENIKRDVEEEINDVRRLKNLHAMIVQISKDHCRKVPECEGCPLNNRCIYFLHGKQQGAIMHDKDR